MKLKSIKKIKGYKSFRDFSWQRFLNNEPFHDKVNLFYGENGSGKSSIVNILKDLSENKEFVKYRPTDACLGFDDGDRKYTTGIGWDRKVPKDSILFFDREFVGANVHLGQKRGTTQDEQEQQSGKMIIEFDSVAIKLREVRDKANEAQIQKRRDLKKFNNLNKDLLNFTLDGDAEKKFYDMHKGKTKARLESLRQKLDEKKEEVKEQLKDDQKRQTKTSSIQQIKSLSKLKTEFEFSSYETYQSVFNFDLIEKVENDADRALTDKIRTHKSFFETGLVIRKTHQDTCPFCQSQNEERAVKKVLDLYRHIYDETYEKQRQKFEECQRILIAEISQIIETLRGLNLNKIFFELKRLDEKYEIPNIYSVSDEETYTIPKVQKLTELSSKISSLAKPSSENIQHLYNESKSELGELKEFFKLINGYIEQKNQLIARFQSENTDEMLRSRISENTEKVAKFNKAINFINEGKIDTQRRKEETEKELRLLKKEARRLKDKHHDSLKQYEEYCSTKAFSNLLLRIQSYFKKFNFDFKLELSSNFTGNKKDFPFAFKVLDLEGNERDFQEGLSEGEVQVLSLCFFFAFLGIPKNKKDKILIFDDPITSLDNSNLSCLVDIISEKQEIFSQTFVFTHHKTFFKFLRNRFARNCYEYNLIRNKKKFGGSFICKSTSKKFLDELGNFEKHLLSIPPDKLDIELKIVEYGQYLRYEIERYIKHDILYWDANSFSVALEGVKNNKKISDQDLDSLKQIYAFCNWTTSHVDTDDNYGLELLKSKITDFLLIVRPPSTQTAQP